MKSTTKAKGPSQELLDMIKYYKLTWGLDRGVHYHLDGKVKSKHYRDLYKLGEKEGLSNSFISGKLHEKEPNCLQCGIEITANNKPILRHGFMFGPEGESKHAFVCRDCEDKREDKNGRKTKTETEKKEVN
ncbi:MAG: hypothetical protein M3044_03925 [Thermoproteota archaeon]|nr:hypothetical protein [Thermoproteota archaeon]